MTFENWLQFRKRGIGASETGAVLGLSEYESPLSIFYEKSSLITKTKPENLPMFFGKNSEDFIANFWEYWDGDDQTMIANFNAGRKVRKCQNVNGYIQNPKWKWLFVSLDRKINKNTFHGKQFGEGCLELKNMSGFEVQKWEFGIPSNYLIQVQTQMLVCGFEYGELCILQDGRKLVVHQFEFNKEIGDAIVEKTNEFWQKVEAGRQLKTQIFEAKKNFNLRLVEELEAKFIELEPPIDGSDAVASFLTEKYKNGTAGERVGRPDELLIAIKHRENKNTIKELEAKVQVYENQLKHSMKDVECLNFGKDGRIYWSNSKNGSRVFRNNLKR